MWSTHPAGPGRGRTSRADPAAPVAQEALQLVPHVPGLGRVAAQGRDLAGEGVGDVHRMGHLRVRHDPDLADVPRLQVVLLDELGPGINGSLRRGRWHGMAASPAARWSGWDAWIRSYHRSGDWIRTRCGRTSRITSTIWRCSSQEGSSQPSRCPGRNRTSLTPSSAEAATCSRSGWQACLHGWCPRTHPAHPACTGGS